MGSRWKVFFGADANGEGFRQSVRREKLGRLHCLFFWGGGKMGVWPKTRFEVPKFDDFDDEVEKSHRDQQKVKKWILHTPHHILIRAIKSRYRFGFTKYSTNVRPRDQKRYSRWRFKSYSPLLWEDPHCYQPIKKFNLRSVAIGIFVWPYLINFQATKTILFITPEHGESAAWTKFITNSTWWIYHDLHCCFLRHPKWCRFFWCIKTIFCVNFRGGQHPKLTHTLNNQGFWSLLIWVFQLLGVKVPDLSGTNGWSAKKIPIFLNDPPRKMNMSFLGTISTTGKGSSSSTIVFQGPSKSWEE